LNISDEVLKNYARYRTDPWAFLSECVYTIDEVDAKEPIKKFPAHLEYLRLMTMMWMQFKKLAIPKSRRMTASWTFIGLMLWDCIFHKGRSWACVSKKEEDSKELVSRAEFIYNHIPENRIPKDLLPKMKHGKMQTSPPVIEFEEINSKIQGFPSGANQLRQRGFSGILEDECAFWADAEDSYASAEPTVRGGGRMIMISSRAIEDKGFFKRIVFDQLDSKDTRFPEVPPVKPSHPMQGVQVWTNPKNGFTICELHYTANPEKRGEVFREGLKASLPIRKYRMEYEKSWETFEGRPVYEDFNENIHVTQSKPPFVVGLPLLLGWDSSGLTPAVVFGQLQEDRLIIYREFVGAGMGAVRFVPLVISEIKMNFPQITDLGSQVVSFFDPAGFKRNEITEQTYIQSMVQHGFSQVRPGPISWNKRVDGVTALLVGLSKGLPRLQIYERDCPILVAGFKGGYRYSDSVSHVEPDKIGAVKDIHSHVHDGLQYLCGGLQNYKKETGYDQISTPSYGFQKQENKTTMRSQYGRTIKEDRR
jgi:hypothetical protein